MCGCGRGPIHGRIRRCHFCNREAQKRYRKTRKCPHCGNLVSLKSLGLSPDHLAALKTQRWDGPAEPNFKHLPEDKRKKLFEEIAVLINKSHISEADHEAAIAKIQLHKTSPRCPYAVFAGFKVYVDGQWWKVIEAGAELVISRRAPHSSSLQTKTIQRTQVEDVRCGPGGNFVMLQAPPGDYHKPHAKWIPRPVC